MRALLLLLLPACHASVPAAPVAVAHPPVETSAPSEPDAAVIEPVEEGDLLEHQARPTLRATLEIDPETLPLAAWGPPRQDSWLSFMAGEDGSRRFHVEGVSYAEVRVGDFLGFTGDVDGFATDAWPECGPGKPRRPGTWRGISTVGWTDASVSIVMSRGQLDSVSCVALASATLVGRASAIVPRFVYALRFEDEGKRFVYVIMPGGWLAVASDGRAGRGAFSAVVLPLEPHHERAAALRISSFGLARWRGMPQLAASPRQLDVVDEPASSPLVVVEVRARGERSVLALSVATIGEGAATKTDFVAAIEARAMASR